MEAVGAGVFVEVAVLVAVGVFEGFETLTEIGVWVGGTAVGVAAFGEDGDRPLEQAKGKAANAVKKSNRINLAILNSADQDPRRPGFERRPIMGGIPNDGAMVRLTRG